MISVSEGAATKVHEIQKQNGLEGYGLRVGVRGGGCSGLTYLIEFAQAPDQGDFVYENHGVRLFVDKKSYLYLIGTELVFKETLMESGFEFNNPNSRKSCGCGESFTI